MTDRTDAALCRIGPEVGPDQLDKKLCRAGGPGIGLGATGYPPIPELFDKEYDYSSRKLEGLTGIVVGLDGTRTRISARVLR